MNCYLDIRLHLNHCIIFKIFMIQQLNVFFIVITIIIITELSYQTLSYQTHRSLNRPFKNEN